MNSQTINTTNTLFAQNTVAPLWSALSQKKAAISLGVLAVGGLMLVMFAALWMPTMMVIDLAATSAMIMGVLTSEKASASSIAKKSLQSVGVLAVGGFCALLSSVLYTIFSF